MLQEIQLGISIPGLLFLGIAIALILILMGRAEKENSLRSRNLIGMGSILMGIMILIAPLSWFMYWAARSGNLVMTIGEIAALSLISALGGIVIGAGLLKLGQRVEQSFQ